jgi:monoterpene epsilon-lactone hydrolase
MSEDLGQLKTRADVARRIAQVPMNGSPQELRAQFLRLSDACETGDPATIGGVNVRVSNARAARTLVYLHGGGYVFGSPLSHCHSVRALAQMLDWRIIVPDYRLAPEHKWPAQRDDVCAVVDALTGPVALAGDSAGGHLAITTALARPARISRLALVAPNTDRSGQSRTRGAPTDPMNDGATDAALAALCFGDMPASHADVSPLLADLRGLPPMYLTAAVNEVLLDDTLLFATAAARAGVPVEVDIIAPLFHMWTLWPQALAQARESLRKIAAFIDD